jgi:3D (Asp-Asp-Asp) domain-containing protein
VSVRRERPKGGALAVLVAASALSGCAWFRGAPEVPAKPVRELEVTATAYNSLASQTDSSPSVTAFGIRLKPGMRIVAVSRDLEKLGLRQGVRLTISGLDGEWTVGDRMHGRWSKKIDVYMGVDVKAARAWGRRKVVIRW